MGERRCLPKVKSERCEAESLCLLSTHSCRQLASEAKLEQHLTSSRNRSNPARAAIWANRSIRLAIGYLLRRGGHSTSTRERYRADFGKIRQRLVR